MADIWIRATRLIGAISIPALVGLTVSSRLTSCKVVLGSKWEDATPVIQILALVGVIQSLHTLNAEVLLALNKAGTLVRYTRPLGSFDERRPWRSASGGASSASRPATQSRRWLVEPLRAYITTQGARNPTRTIHVSLGGRCPGDRGDGSCATRCPHPGSSRWTCPPVVRLVVLFVLGGARGTSP